jgi:hypothetical protein
MIIIVALIVYSTNTLANSKGKYIDRLKAIEIAKRELKDLDISKENWSYGAEFKPMTIPEFMKFTERQEEGLINRAKKWIKGHKFWRCAGGPKGTLDDMFFVFVDAYTGDVLCIIPFIRPIPQEWVVRYDELQKARTKKK